MRHLLLGVMASAGLLLSAALSRAEDKLPANDRDFVQMAATAGHAEVKFAELAEKRAANDKVKEFAQHVVKDHSEANKELAEHARNQKVAVAAGFERDKRDIYNNLSKLNGADFDRAFMKQMVEDHEAALKLFEHESSRGMDPDLKKFAESKLMTLRDHLKMAREINGMVNK